MSKQYQNQKDKWIKFGREQERKEIIKIINELHTDWINTPEVDIFVEDLKRKLEEKKRK